MEAEDRKNVIHLLRLVYSSIAMKNKDVKTFVNGFIKREFCGKRFFKYRICFIDSSFIIFLFHVEYLLFDYFKYIVIFNTKNGLQLTKQIK